MKKTIKMNFVILLIIGMILVNNFIFASNDWWGSAYSFFNGNYTATNISALSDIQSMIEFIGNMIFVATTVILGVKYIWGSVESKASVKDSLVTLVVAALFFYGWSTIKDMFIGGNGILKFGNNYQVTANSIYSTILYICNFLAVGGIVYVGVRYMMAGADGKAQLKAKGVPMVLGIIMVYATITFLKFIVSII